MEADNSLTDLTTSSDGSPALDDIAALLVRTDARDANGMSRVRDMLQVVLSHVGEGVELRWLERALQGLQSLSSGKASDPEGTASLVGRAIQAAVDTIEGYPVEDDDAPLGQDVAEAPNEDAVELLPPDADPDFLLEFVSECGEFIESAEASLLTLETNPRDEESVNTVFRAFHTIKGTSAFLGLDRISELSHLAESLLSRVRDGEVEFAGVYTDLALRSIDMLKDLVQGVEAALNGEPVVIPEGCDELMEHLVHPETVEISGDDGDFGSAPRLGDILVAGRKAERENVESIAQSLDGGPIGQALVKADAASVTDVAKALRTQKKIAAAEPAAESSVRVRTDRLDRLIDMVGELVIAHSMVAQDGDLALSEHHELLKKVTHAGKIVRELQQLSMSMRMVPLRSTLQKMARLARDVAHKSGKLVSFTTDGDDIEIDRNMVDTISDPLVHMVRNAIDHGIESPDLREASGKPRTGAVHLSAYHSGGSVVVEMRDDGKGLDREKIIEKALAKGLIGSDKDMSEGDIYDLILAPGFSTADRVTDVSGRGVGLDVVRKNVEAARGRIELWSEQGRGCTFTLRLPLTMAVTDGMLVKVGQESFIIPMTSINMSFRPEPEALSTVTGRGELVMFRGELMPVFRLHRLFEINGAVKDPAEGLLIVLDDGDRNCAFLVDEILGQYHVVAKSLGAGIGNVRGISGAAILGDGRVGLIIDPTGIISLATQGRAEMRKSKMSSRLAA